MKHLRGALPALVLVVAVFVVAWIGRASDGRRALADCDAALIRGDRIDAIVYGRAAAEARCPGCSAPANGFAKLYAIAKDSESKADDPTAIAAWRAVRVATLTSMWTEADEPRRLRADTEIARLEHRVDVMSGTAGGNPSPAANEDRLRAALAPNPLPSTTVFLVIAVGAFALLFGAIRSARAKMLNAPDIALAIGGVVVAVIGVVAF